MENVSVKYGYGRQWCDYCERITPHEDTMCMDCRKLAGESIEHFIDRQKDEILRS